VRGVNWHCDTGTEFKIFRASLIARPMAWSISKYRYSPKRPQIIRRLIPATHMMPPEQAGRVTGTVITREYPYTSLDSDHYEYPFPYERNLLHIGGNVHDYLHSSGVRIHTYGPHYFRTNSNETWQFVNRFAEFFPYEAVLVSSFQHQDFTTGICQRPRDGCTRETGTNDEEIDSEGHAPSTPLCQRAQRWKFSARFSDRSRD
jgi:hypothetical protein